MTTSKPHAVVLNMFYTGLGIARSLGSRGVSVTGLSADRWTYGNSTRFARIRMAPDSRADPEGLAAYLRTLAREFDAKPVLFPTRDHDVLFMDRYRDELDPHFNLVLPAAPVLKTCINKWETHQWAVRAGVPAPDTRLIDGEQSLTTVSAEVSYPCVLKPLEAHHWRTGENWEIVGSRKAIGVHSPRELKEEYARVSLANRLAVVQDMIPGGDQCLFAAGCYMSRQAQWVGGFTVQKLVQSPAIFGTGCILQTVNRPDLLERTRRLLESIGYSGIAEVEYKFDSRTGEDLLIEVNPRPWDQHTLGRVAGVDVVYLAYCDHAGIPFPAPETAEWDHKWLAEDAFLIEAVRMAGRRDSQFRTLFERAKGRRTHAIFSWRDPKPFGAYLLRGLPALARDVFRAAVPALTHRGHRLQAHGKAEVL